MQFNFLHIYYRTDQYYTGYLWKTLNGTLWLYSSSMHEHDYYKCCYYYYFSVDENKTEIRNENPDIAIKLYNLLVRENISMFHWKKQLLDGRDLCLKHYDLKDAYHGKHEEEIHSL